MRHASCSEANPHSKSSDRCSGNDRPTIWASKQVNLLRAGNVTAPLRPCPLAAYPKFTFAAKVGHPPCENYLKSKRSLARFMQK